MKKFLVSLTCIISLATPTAASAAYEPDSGSSACPAYASPGTHCWDNTYGFWIRFWYDGYWQRRYICRVPGPGSFQCI